MKKALSRLNAYYVSSATVGEKDVLYYILTHPVQAAGMDIHTLAKNGYCSASTIVRLCQKTGFAGYRDLRDSLNQEIAGSSFVVPSDPASDPMQDLFRTDMEALQNTALMQEPEILEKVVDLLCQAECIYLFGCSSSRPILSDLEMKLAKIHKPCFCSQDASLQKIVACNMNPGEVCLIVSSTKDREMIEIAGIVQDCQGTVISLTENLPNLLAGQADYSLYVAHCEGNEPHLEGTARLCMMAVVDLLYSMMVNKRSIMGEMPVREVYRGKGNGREDA